MEPTTTITDVTILDADQQLKRFELTPKDIANNLREKYAGLTISGLADKEGYRAVSEARSEIRQKRLAVEKTRKALTEDAVAYQRKINAYAKELTELITPIEDHLAAELDRYEAEKERVKREKAEAEAKRVAGLSKMLLEAGCQFDGMRYFYRDMEVLNQHLPAMDEEALRIFADAVQTMKAKDDAEKAEKEARQKKAANRQSFLVTEGLMMFLTNNDPDLFYMSDSEWELLVEALRQQQEYVNAEKRRREQEQADMLRKMQEQEAALKAADEEKAKLQEEARKALFAGRKAQIEAIGYTYDPVRKGFSLYFDGVVGVFLANAEVEASDEEKFPERLAFFRQLYTEKKTESEQRKAQAEAAAKAAMEKAEADAKAKAEAEAKQQARYKKEFAIYREMEILDLERGLITAQNQVVDIIVYLSKGTGIAQQFVPELVAVKEKLHTILDNAKKAAKP